MKEILYLDDELVNSCLAQLDRGLAIKFSNSLNMIKKDGEKTTEETIKSVDAGINALFKGGISYENNYSEETTNNYASDHGEVKETVLSDFSLDVLLAKLIEDKLIVSDRYTDGDFILEKNSFKIFDFARLETVTSDEYINLFNPVKKHNDKINQEIHNYKGKEAQIVKSKLKSQLKESGSMENFTHVYNFGKFGNAIFPNSCLFKVDSFLGVCPKKNLRYNDILLSLLNESNRTASILGIVIYQRGENYIQTNDKGEVIQLDSQTIASSAPTMLMDTLLDNFKISDTKDYFIRPIAIYFE